MLCLSQHYSCQPFLLFKTAKPVDYDSNTVFYLLLVGVGLMLGLMAMGVGDLAGEGMADVEVPAAGGGDDLRGGMGTRRICFGLA